MEAGKVARPLPAIEPIEKHASHSSYAVPMESTVASNGILHQDQYVYVEQAAGDAIYAKITDGTQSVGLNPSKSPRVTSAAGGPRTPGVDFAEPGLSPNTPKQISLA